MASATPSRIHLPLLFESHALPAARNTSSSPSSHGKPRAHPSRLGSVVISERLLTALHPFQNKCFPLCAPITPCMSIPLHYTSHPIVEAAFTSQASPVDGELDTGAIDHIYHCILSSWYSAWHK